MKSEFQLNEFSPTCLLLEEQVQYILTCLKHHLAPLEEECLLRAVKHWTDTRLREMEAKATDRRKQENEVV